MLIAKYANDLYSQCYALMGGRGIRSPCMLGDAGGRRCGRAPFDGGEPLNGGIRRFPLAVRRQGGFVVERGLIRSFSGLFDLFVSCGLPTFSFLGVSGFSCSGGKLSCVLGRSRCL